MLRRFGFFLLASSALSAVPLASADAQYYRAAPEPYYRAAPPQRGYQDDRLPAPGYLLEDDDAPIVRRPPNRPQFSQNPQQVQPGAPSNILPYPDAAPPQSGHQLGATPAPGNMPPAANADPVMRPPGSINSRGPGVAPAPIPQSAASALPPEDQPEIGQPKALAENLKKQLVDYSTKEPAGTIVVDTPNTYLYLVLGNGKAIRYGIGVGREGFTWTGSERVSKMSEWPDWHPPSEMIERQPYLPRFMAGGPGNPLGARALYLGKTLYRIHGTNQPSTIGQTVSSGCIRLINEDIEDLFSRVQVGSRVVVLPGQPPATVANSGAPPEPANPMAPPPRAAAPAPTGTAISGQPLPPAR